MNHIIPSDNKGIYLPTLALFMILIIGAQIYFFFVKAPQNFKDTLGEEHVTLMNSYLEGETDLYRLDQVVKYSAEQAIRNLYAHGAMYDTSSCSLHGNTIIIASTPACTPAHPAMLTALQSYFKDNLPQYLQLLPFDIGLDDYDITIESDKNSLIITGMTTRTHTYTTPSSTYTIPLAFQYALPRTFDAYYAALNILAHNSNCLRDTPYNALIDSTTYLIKQCSLDTDTFSAITRDGDMLTVTASIDNHLIFFHDIDTQFAINLNTIIKDTETITASLTPSQATRGDITLSP